MSNNNQAVRDFSNFNVRAAEGIRNSILTGVENVREENQAISDDILAVFDDLEQDLDLELGSQAKGLFFNTLGIATQEQKDQGLTSDQVADQAFQTFQGTTRKQLLDEQLQKDQQTFSRQAAAQGGLASGRFAAGLQDLGQTRANEAFNIFQQNLAGAADSSDSQRFALTEGRVGEHTRRGDTELQALIAQGGANADFFTQLLGFGQAVQNDASKSLALRAKQLSPLRNALNAPFAETASKLKDF